MTYVVVETPLKKIVFAPATADVFEQGLLEVTDTHNGKAFHIFQAHEWTAATVLDDLGVMFSIEKQARPIRVVTLQ